MEKTPETINVVTTTDTVVPVLFKMTLETDVLKVGFGEPAQNNEILKYVAEILKGIDFKGGKVLKINGPASLPVAVMIAHHISHLYGAVAVFDPKLAGYVVAVSHHGDYQIGDIIPLSDNN